MQLPDPLKELIAEGPIAHVHTINRDGSPDVTMAWIGIEDDEVVIGTLGDQRKLQNMRRDPRVAISVHTNEMNEFGLMKYAVIHGRARVVEGGAPELLQRLAHTYLGPDVKFPPMPDPPPGYVTRVAAERVKGIGPWTEA
jgi:PPOX class probable F420-dependent enzyme